jgi:predicted permease
MEVLYTALSWGTPLGLGLFFFLSASGAGILFWGISRFAKANHQKEEN